MAGIYNRAKAKILDGSLNLLTANLKVMLVTSAYVFNPDHDFVSTPAVNELSGTGYVGGFGGSGRKAITGRSVTEDDTLDRGFLDGSDITWPAINSGTAAASIIFVEGTTDGDSTLVAYIDTGGFPKVTNGADLVLAWSNSPAGIVQAS